MAKSFQLRYNKYMNLSKNQAKTIGKAIGIDFTVVKFEEYKKEAEENNKEGKTDYRRWEIVRLDEAISEMADRIDEQARDSAYSDAYSDAFEEGKSEGYDKGYREGLEEGRQESRGE